MLTETINPDYQAALHLLHCPLLAGRTAPYIKGDEIAWDEIYHDLWPKLSRSEQLLIDAALDLFGGVSLRRVSLREVVTLLDGENFNPVCEAVLGLRRLLVGSEF